MSKNSKKIIISVSILAVLIISIFVFKPKKVEELKSIPSFSLKNTAEEEANQDVFKNYDLTVVTFWATT